MDALAAAGSAVSVESILAAKQQKISSEVQVGMLKKGLDLQKDLASQLFKDMGIGQNLDLRA